jgi:hypothetical protein
MGLIDALDLRLIDPESEDRVPVDDFQIWRDGNASCRLRALSPQFLNGTAAPGESAAPGATPRK